MRRNCGSEPHGALRSRPVRAGYQVDGTAGVKLVGPSLAGVAKRAATRKADFPAELYLYESITHPEAYVVDGFQSGIMPGNFRQRLNEQQLADLIAFLMTR